MDESQQNDHYFVAAALGHVRDWQTASSCLDAVRASASEVYGTPRDAEFHGHPLMNGRDDWKALRTRYREAGNTYLRALSVLDDLDISFFIRGVDVRRLNARYRYPDLPHELCMRHVLERLDSYATAHQIPGIRIVSDVTSEERALQHSLHLSHEYGTRGYRPSKLERICAPIEFMDSSETDGLQIVDLALYIKQREFHTPQERNSKAEAMRRRLLGKIDPKVIVNQVWKP